MVKQQLITILGSTGSIGISTLDVVRRHKDQFAIFALTANTSDELLASQIVEFSPRYAVMRDPDCAERLRERLRQQGASDTEVLWGEEGLVQVAEHAEVDQVMAAIVGAAGLVPTLAAVKASKRILLANKEALVMSGALFMEAARTHRAELLPIDSEHNAIFQCMPADFSAGLAVNGIVRLLLTASGGPFRDCPLESLASVTPEQACAHPNWSMGQKISVDSATMMNKGLELIEACWLFGAKSTEVEVVIHPQSVIHSMVEYQDGSVIAQLGNPDMRTPIAYGLGWPNRISSGVPLLDLVKVATLEFRAPDEQRFPCLRLAREAMTRGDSAPAILNAANEVAVAGFLQGSLRFIDIPVIIEQVLTEIAVQSADTVERILAVDQQARLLAAELLAQRVQVVS